MLWRRPVASASAEMIKYPELVPAENKQSGLHLTHTSTFINKADFYIEIIMKGSNKMLCAVFKPITHSTKKLTGEE